MRSVAIIGLGRVGGALAISLPRDKYAVREIIYRNERFLDPVRARIGSGLRAVPFDAIDRIDSDTIFITTQDFEIQNAIGELNGKLGRHGAVFHTSGSQSSLILSPLSEAGWQIGSFHPLVSIPRPELGPEHFRGSYMCVEGFPGAVKVGQQVATDLGGRPFTIDTRFKTLYHASAVMACGHLVALFDAAVEIMTKCGLSGEEAKAILLPLVSSTVSNLETGSTAAALTGTFARADTETFTRHIATLNENVSDELLEIYLLLGERSLELAAKQGISSDRIEMMRAKVSIAKTKLKW